MTHPSTHHTLLSFSPTASSPPPSQQSPSSSKSPNPKNLVEIFNLKNRARRRKISGNIDHSALGSLFSPTPSQGLFGLHIKNRNSKVLDHTPTPGVTLLDCHNLLPPWGTHPVGKPCRKGILIIFPNLSSAPQCPGEERAWGSFFSPTLHWLLVLALTLVII